MSEDFDDQLNYSFWPGEEIGAYKVESALGKGGMGAVYHARHARIQGLEVAIKVINPEPGSDKQELLDRLEEECRALAKLNSLNHPNVISIQHADIHVRKGGVGKPDINIPYVVMPFARGESLEELLRNGKMGVQQSVRVCATIAEGLAAAHSVGIIHRDIKPKNVMVSLDSEPPIVKIIDFGISKMLVGSAGLSGKYNNIVGSIPYMPPERLTALVKGDDEYRDVPVGDVYSLGVTLYHALTDMADFPTNDLSPPEMAQKLIAWVPKSIGDSSLDRVLAGMLRKDWTERISARRAASDLRRVYDNMTNSGLTQGFRIRNQYDPQQLILYLAGELEFVDDSQVGEVIFVRADAYESLHRDGTIEPSAIIASTPRVYLKWKIGRGTDAHVRIPHESVSRMHAVLEQRGESYFLRDDKSNNGTSIDGVLVQKGVDHELKPGQHVQFGRSGAYVFAARPVDLRMAIRSDDKTKRFEAPGDD